MNSYIDIAEPKRQMPQFEKDEPSRAKDLSDIDEPM